MADLENQLNVIEASFAVDKPRLQKMIVQLREEMQLGLAQKGQTLKMIPTFVHNLPQGNEKGDFLALDLGGSNFRVLHLKLDGKGGCDIQSKGYDLTEHHKTSDAETLFGFIADCVKDFAPQTVGAAETTPLGFTFSFPVDQTAINSGTLITWTKEFSAKGCEGQDVVALLQTELKKRDLKIDIRAMISDTTGTMLARCLDFQDCYVGLILGTGTNACYFEDLKNIPKWAKTEAKKEGGVVINMEWGAFGDGKTSLDAATSQLPWTKYDEIVAEGLPVGRQLFEKMISGKYQGEIVRLVLVDLIKAGLLFSGQTNPKIEHRYNFDTKYLSAIEADTSDDLSKVAETLAIFDITGAPFAELKAVARICHAVSLRAAKLSAAACCALVLHMGEKAKKSCSIAVDGSVFKYHPTFQKHMEQTLDELRDGQFGTVSFVLAENGSGKGAGMVVAAACATASQ